MAALRQEERRLARVAAEEAALKEEHRACVSQLKEQAQIESEKDALQTQLNELREGKQMQQSELQALYDKWQAGEMPAQVKALMKTASAQ